MSWSDTAEIQNRLDAALNAYQWHAADQACEDLIRCVRREPSPIPVVAARQLLGALRKKRQFRLAARVAEAFLRSGQTSPFVRRQYAQALIDQGMLLAAESQLEPLLTETLDGDNQVAEAHGLLGRIYKQLYVEADAPSNPYTRMFFERALSEYLQIYRVNPLRNSWHGINVVALLHRGKADGIDVRVAPAADDLATEVLASLPEPGRVADAFDLATRLEALIALGRHREAEAAALEYAGHPDADAFEIGSTLRQLEQVWRLTVEDPLGSTILPVLRAARLRREGGAIETTPAQVDREIQLTRQAANRLEKIFGDDRMVTLQWYEEGLQRTKAIARVERLNGKGHGTGWLVRAADFFPADTPIDGEVPELLLLTNAHVINADGSGGALAPDAARANVQGLGQRVDCDRIVWSSPPDKLDATFVTLKARPDTSPVPLFEKKVRFTEPASRVYIIGHPGGRDLELSLHDNLLLGCDDVKLHYRTPTEGGSSGSPVFEAEDWRAIGLHHAGGTFERLDGKQPPYDANEGISIRAIKARIAASPRGDA